MDLNYSAADDAFRQEVRGWLQANLPKDIQDKVLNHRRLSREDFVRWHKALAGKGWSVPHWPVEWGGTGWSPIQKHIWDEECAEIGAPGVLPFGVTFCAAPCTVSVLSGVEPSAVTITSLAVASVFTMVRRNFSRLAATVMVRAPLLASTRTRRSELVSA